VIPALERALSHRGIEFSLYPTEAPGHARDLAVRARSEASRILVVGGDGTVHEVVDGLLSDEGVGAEEIPPIAVLPVGTGNDFFRMVRAGNGMADAVGALESGVPRAFEVGEVRWATGRRIFVNLVGVGIDVEVLRRRASFRRLPGLLQYLAALGSALRRYEPLPLRVVVLAEDGAEIVLDAPVLLSAVTVGPSVGGGFLLSPDAVPDDGLLDLFHAEPLGVLKVLRYLPGILRGSGVERPEISLCRGTEVHIQRTDDRGLAFELDGELVETPAPRLAIRVLPGRLPVLEPAA
jgi:diacylglycerol kinase (ATP)